MIDLQATLYSAQMISDATKATGDALRVDATKYVKDGNFRLATIAVVLADFCDAINVAKRLLEEEIARAPR